MSYTGFLRVLAEVCLRIFPCFVRCLFSSAHPRPSDQPTAAPVAAPVTAPVAAPVTIPPAGSQQRWAAFAQFVPDWEGFKARRGNGVCDPLEECRTDEACCDTSTTAVCGNGFCEEGKTISASLGQPVYTVSRKLQPV